jgi:hypothetical protein
MTPNLIGLQKLADAYLHFLVHQDAEPISRFLSLDFLRRQRVTSQIRLISQLPQLIFGVGLETCLREVYPTHSKDGAFYISPFQFDIASVQTSFIEPERTTITLHSLVLEDGEWKFDAIVTNDDVAVLQNLVDRINKRKVPAASPAQV